MTWCESILIWWTTTRYYKKKQYYICCNIRLAYLHIKKIYWKKYLVYSKQYTIMAKWFLTSEEKILVSLKSIPRGKVTTYKALSKKFGCHPRIIIAIMKKNKLPDINPCYKVLPNDASLWWYIFGEKERRRRLEENGVGIKNGIVEDKYILRELK